MPYRELPKSDVTRLQALQLAAAKAAAVAPEDLAFSSATRMLLDGLLPQFQAETAERGQALAAQTAASQALREQAARLRMYVSHFLQTLNLAIERGVIPATDRAHYQLDVSQTSQPNMTREADLTLWADRTVTGEASRTMAGGAAIPFPSSGEVQMELAQFTTLRDDQSGKKDAYDSEQEAVDALRDDVDSVIRDIWDEVEFTFRRDDPSSLRRKAREYGVVYASRADEPDENGGGSEPTTARYNTTIVGTDTEITLEVPLGLDNIQELKLVHNGIEFVTAFSPMPGETVMTSWPGMAISGAIDEVKIQNGAGEDIAVGVFDPTLAQ